jgi:glycerate-2-kinase
MVAAVGKAACPMVTGALAERAVEAGSALVVTKEGHGQACPREMTVLEAGHPTPDRRSLLAGEELLRRVAELGEGDELLLLVSGGASALAEVLPAGIPEEAWFAANRALVGGGLPIAAINAVRKHCSRLKGGQLARAASPARVTTLLVSDVIGDDPAVIGSGPTAPDPSRFEEAREVAARVADFPAAIKEFLAKGAGGELAETPKPGELEHVTQAVVASNRQALQAAAAYLAGRGWRSWILSSRLQGEARSVARALAAVALETAESGNPVQPPAALLWGGETTVTLGPEPGEGGRSQELALALGEDLAASNRIGALCAGTDGTDGPGEAAGGWVDGTTVERSRRLGYPVPRALDRHDSGGLLARLGDQIVTGPTGTNVMDLVVLLVQGPSSASQ